MVMKMGIFNTVGDGVTKAIDFVVEKNRKIALINRVKMVIRNEQNNADLAYIALGKYYYRNMRDEDNSETEPFCAAAEKAINRRDRALLKLDELTSPCDCRSADVEEDECGECDSDCSDCPYSDDDDNEDLGESMDYTAAFAPEQEEQEEAESELPHPELVWNDTDTVEETKNDVPAGEAADDAFGGTIPTDQF
jgi:hypothetical protein